MAFSVARRPLFLMAIVLAAGVSESVAQKTKSAAPYSQSSRRIFVEQQVEQALQVLRSRNIGFNEGGMAMVIDEDTSYFTFTLDENHAFACLLYSKSSGKVSRISMCFFPHRELVQKMYRSWLDAEELRIHPDGGYTVHFAKPPAMEEVRRQEAAARAESESSFAEDSLEQKDIVTSEALGLDVPVVTASELDKHVGSLVAVVGTPNDTKIVRLSNVEVRCSDELRGQLAIAVGILGRWVVSEQQAEEMSRRGLAHDGPGVKYILYADLQGKNAEAKPVHSK